MRVIKRREEATHLRRVCARRPRRCGYSRGHPNAHLQARGSGENKKKRENGEPCRGRGTRTLRWSCHMMFLPVCSKSVVLTLYVCLSTRLACLTGIIFPLPRPINFPIILISSQTRSVIKSTSTRSSERTRRKTRVPCPGSYPSDAIRRSQRGQFAQARLQTGAEGGCPGSGCPRLCRRL